MLKTIRFLSNLSKNITNKSKFLIFITFVIGTFSAICESYGVIAVSKFNFENTLFNLGEEGINNSSKFTITIIILLLTCIFNLLKIRFTAITAASISSNLSNNLLSNFISSDSKNKNNRETINLSKNALKELARRYFAPMLLLPNQLLCAFAILISLAIASSLKVVLFLFIAIFLNLFLAFIFGKKSDELLNASIELDLAIEDKVNNFAFLSDELVANRLSKENKKNLINLLIQSREKFMLSTYTVRIAGIITPLINFGVIVYALSSNLVDNKQILALIFAMQRGNASLSSVISSISNLVGGSSTIEKIFKALNTKNNQKNYYSINQYNNKYNSSKHKIVSGIYIKNNSNHKIFESKSGLEISFNNEDKDSSIKSFFLPISNGIISIYGSSGSGKTTYLKNMIGLGYEKNLYSQFLINNEKTPIFSSLITGYYCSHQMPQLNMNLGEYLLEGKDKNYHEKKSLRNLYKLNQKNKILWFKKNNYKNWISHSLSKISLGEKNRVKLLKAFYHDPFWYALDEPTNGLDQDSSENIIKTIKLLSQKAIFIIVSHDRKILEISDYNIHLK